jgi:hypothetical protein
MYSPVVSPRGICNEKRTFLFDLKSAIAYYVPG